MAKSDSKKVNAEALTPEMLRLKAMDLLTRREYSRQELGEKLSSKLALDGQHAAILTAVLDRLIEDKLLSDQRFAEALVRSRLHKGRGPQRIIQELRKRGVKADVASAVLADSGADWYQLATTVANKKYGARPAADRREIDRRSRFLRYRGFTADQITYALRSEATNTGKE